MNTWEFLNANWFLVWCALWLGWPLAFLLELVVFNLPNRLLRTIRVCVRGWPPEHLDADGDFQKEDES